MELYIEVKNGVPTNHPALKENLIAAFKALPEGWEPFVRVERPVLAFDEMLESASPAYQQVDGVWTDVWAVQTLTINEIEAKKEAVKQAVLDSWMLRPDVWLLRFLFRQKKVRHSYGLAQITTGKKPLHSLKPVAPTGLILYSGHGYP